MTPQEGLFGWVGGHLWALWGILALLLATLEMATLDLTLLMLALGALAGGLTSVVLPDLYWAQVLVALGTAVALQTMARPSLLKRLDTAPGYRSSLGKLVGSEGVATQRITRTEGEAKVNGEEKSKALLDRIKPTTDYADLSDCDIVIEAGADIEVYEVDGPILVVYPVERGELLPRPSTEG